MKNINKVIGFDGWTGGVRHYERFAKKAIERGLISEFKLIHLGSWGAQPHVEKREQIGHVECIDISAYGKMSFEDILLKEKPDLVVFLSTHVFDHRAMIKQCKKHNIKTLHIFPGLLGALAINSKNVYKFKLSTHLTNLVDRLPKLLKYTFPNYVRNLIATNARFSDWCDFFTDLAFGAMRLNKKKYSNDSTADKCLVYIESEKDIAVDKYGYCPSNVEIIGLPDLEDYEFKEQDILALANNEMRDHAIYFDTGYLYTGDVFSSVDDYVQHILEIKIELLKKGINLVFKPKPQEGNKVKDELLKKLNDNDIEVYEGKELKELYSNSQFVMTEPSTVGLSAAVMGLPVFLIGFNKFSGQEYGKCLHDYPLSFYASNISDLSQVIDNRKFDELESWISKTFDGNPVRNVSEEIFNHIECMLYE